MNMKENHMYKMSARAISWSAIGLFFASTMSSTAFAQNCGCPDDGHGITSRQQNSVGLGQSFPDTPDLADSPAWAVYEFERDGVRYVQINDQSGAIRAAVGRIDNTFWVMPIGSDVNRVSVLGDPWPTGQQTVLVLTANLKVVRIVNGGLSYWRVQAP
jgi:hypothetical protein